jgi:hypothetical protein
MPQADHLHSIHEDAGTAILDTARGVLSTLNSTGGLIWQALHEGKREADIVRLLVAETNGAPESIAKDVAEFICELRANGLAPLEGEEVGHADSSQTI